MNNIKIMKGYYAVRAGDPSLHPSASFLGGAYTGDVAVVALAFNYTTGALASSGRRAVLKAALASLLLRGSGLEVVADAADAAAEGGQGSSAKRGAGGGVSSYSTGKSVPGLTWLDGGSKGDETLITRFSVALLRATTASESGSGRRSQDDEHEEVMVEEEEMDSAVWAVRLEVTSSVSAQGFQTAVQWKDFLKATLAASETSAHLATALGHLPGNNRPPNHSHHQHPSLSSSTSTTTTTTTTSTTTTSVSNNNATDTRLAAAIDPLSVRAVVAARQPRSAANAAVAAALRGSSSSSNSGGGGSGGDGGSGLGLWGFSGGASSSFDSSDPSSWLDFTPLSLSFNVSATVAGLDDSVCVLNHEQRLRLRATVLLALGLVGPEDMVAVTGMEEEGEAQAGKEQSSSDDYSSGIAPEVSSWPRLLRVANLLTRNEDSGDIGADDGEDGLIIPRVRNFGVSTARRTRKHGRARGHNGTLLRLPTANAAAYSSSSSSSTSSSSTSSSTSTSSTSTSSTATLGGGTWSVEVVWRVTMDVTSVPSAFGGSDDFYKQSLRAWDNDDPGPFGWKGNVDGLRDGPTSSDDDHAGKSGGSGGHGGSGGLSTGGGGAAGGFGTGDGTGGGGGGVSSTSRGGDEREASGVDPFERWASACHNALAGPRFQVKKYCFVYFFIKCIFVRFFFFFF
jgi:hypothetical protein